MRRTVFIIMLLAGLCIASPTHAQICGDVDHSGSINLGDMSAMMTHLWNGTGMANPQMDMDNRAGVSLADEVRLILDLWGYGGFPGFDCTPDLAYSFTPSPGDTIFIPRLLSVPDGLNSFTVPIRMSLQSTTGGAFVPLFNDTMGGFIVVGFEALESSGGWPMNGSWGSDGTRPTIGVLRSHPDGLAGNHQYFTMTAIRSIDGSTGAYLSLEAQQIDPMRRLCIERDGDLFIPTVVYFDYQLPLDTLKVSPASLSFLTVAGKPSKDTLLLNFTSTGSPITFDISVSESWISLVGVSGSLTTPATVKVAIDATLPEGTYAGALAAGNAVSTAGVAVPLPTVPIAVVAGPPTTYPPGDVNCDGMLDISDLSLIIARLAGTHGPITPCY